MDGRPRSGRRAASLVGLAAVLVVSGWFAVRARPAPAPQVDAAGRIDGATSAGPATARLAPPGTPPEDAGRCVVEGSSPAECRITDSLADPTLPARPAAPDDASAGPPLLPLVRPGSLGRPAIGDLADPAVLVDGQTYFVFSTSAAFLNVPVVALPAAEVVGWSDGTAGWSVADGSPLRDGTGWISRTDAMPTPPAWATDSGIWAPTVERFGRRWVMFFAAKRPDPPDPANAECVGRATANRPEGPYVPEPAPVTCGLGGVHGALDPSVFRDRDGRAYLHVAFGGTSTPLWTIPLDDEALPAGAATPLLRMQQPWERWFLENPSMVFDGRHYVLAYSAGDWRSPSYATGIARCERPTGPCRSDPSGPWLSSAGGVTGPGGLTFFTDVQGRLAVAFHGYSAGGEAIYGARSTFLHPVSLGSRGLSLG